MVTKKERKKELKELEKVKKLREEGLTLGKIAQKMNRSLYWVNSRLNPDYMPLKIRKKHK